MELDDKTIFQVNATLITGVLIFLSLSSTIFGEGIFLSVANQTTQTSTQVNDTPDFSDYASAYAEGFSRPVSIQIMITIAIIVPFVISALKIINDDKQGAVTSLRVGLWVMIAGLYIIAIFSIVAPLSKFD